MLPVFVINLDRRPDRWEAMSAQLDRLGIEAMRIPAVDARLLDAQEEWELTTNGNPPFWRIDLGAAACVLGHSMAMMAFLGSGAPAALILEDDAELASDTPALLHDTDWWPAGARIVRLEEGGAKHRRPLWGPCGRTPTRRILRRLERWCPNAAAYMIDRRGARMALEAFADPSLPADHILFNLRLSKTARRLRPLQIVPAMARQDDNGLSDLLSWRAKRDAKLQGWPRRHRWRRLAQNTRQIPYKIRVLALRATGKVEKLPVSYSEEPPEG